MSRITKKQKILNYIIEKKFSELSIRYTSMLCDLSSQGIVKDYIVKHHPQILKKIFDNDHEKCLQVYTLLQKERIIEAKGLHLEILAWNDDHIYCLNYNLPKEKYSRNPIKGQEIMSQYLQKFQNETQKRFKDMGLPEPIRDEDTTPKDIKINWDKLKGIKLPENLKDLFVGKKEGFSYSKEKIRYICGFLTCANTNGIYYDFNVSNIYNEMVKIFDDSTVAESTCHDVHKKLLEEGVFLEDTDTKTGLKYLKLSGYEEGFRDSNRYVAVHYGIFQEAFKRLETAAMKVFFDTIFKFNNGEGKKGSIDKDKPIIFKARITPSDTRQNRQDYEHKYSWLHKRCPSEILKLFYGKDKQQGLSKFFNIYTGDIIKNGNIKLRVKPQYFISKKEIKRIERQYNVLEQHPKKAAIIKGILTSKINFTYTEEDYKSFVHVLRRTSSRVSEMLLRALDRDIKQRKEERWKEIYNLGGYLKTMLDNYKAGDRIQLQSKKDLALEDKKEALRHLSGEYGY